MQIEERKFIVRDINIKFSKSFRFNDVILIETRHKYAKNSSITIEQLAWSVDGQGNKEYLKTVAMVKLVLIDRNSKVIKIKKYLKSNFFQN